MKILLFVFLFFFLSLCLSAEQNFLDFSNAVIMMPKKTEKLDKKALIVFQEEIAKRTGIRPGVTDKWSETNKPVILVGQKSLLEDLNTSISSALKNYPDIGKEGFFLNVYNQSQPIMLVTGNDSRGVLYGIGKLLRQMVLKKGKILIPADITLASTPRYPIRGHQLGYRPKTNAYDAWDVEQFELYIRELALFGANAIEIMPPRTDDDLHSSHMKVPPMEMMIKQADIIDSYGMDVWIWYPNMGKDYTHPDSLKIELKERDEIFKKLKRIDVVFVPGGDPGDLHPDILFTWLQQVATVLQKYHPTAKIWVSPQAFRPVKEWLDAFYTNVNKKYSWFGGVVFGPWVKTSLPEMRQIVDPELPIRRYPDITHSISCQYPVKDWDLAYAMTLGRECYNPRPAAEKLIHNALDEYADGSLSYSEGINDDVNKFVWSGQDWNPETAVIETLREYSRLFIHPDFADPIAQGLLALEKNWEGRLLINDSPQITLQQWQQLEKNSPEEVRTNYRFNLGLLRAYYDEYIRQRLIYETNLEREAYEELGKSGEKGSLSAIGEVEILLKERWEKPIAGHLKKRCWEIADFLFKEIGSQTSVKKHAAKPGRGDFMDYIEVPLNDAIWLLANFEKIKKIESEEERLEEIQKLINWKNPGPGGFYVNFGFNSSFSLLGKYPAFEEDPGGLKSPRVSFGVGLQGEEWIHTVEAKGFDGSATPMTWMNQITTLYDIPLNLQFENLDPNAEYMLKVAYTGRFRAKIQLVADEKFQIHQMFKTGNKPLWEYEIPWEATKDGTLQLSWTCGEGERGVQLAEIWLIRSDIQ